MAQTKKKSDEQAAAETKAELEEVKAAAAVEPKPKPASKTEAKAKDETGGKPAAKAGKRSAKAVRETEAEADRRDKAAEKAPEKKRVVHTPNYKKRHGKRYVAANELIDKSKQYELAEAIELAQKTSQVKFDASVEMHVNLGVDPKQADQMVRASVSLPHGTGKSQRIAVIAAADQHEAAKKAGANLVGADDLIAKIEKGQLDFDILVATPDQMPKLGKLAKVLGPKGLMPSPKSGTVTPNPAAAVKELKGGKVEFRIDKQAIIHQPIGKVSFTADQLTENAKTLLKAITTAKPAATKGTYVSAISITTSMGPGIKLDTAKALSTKK